MTETALKSAGLGEHFVSVLARMLTPSFDRRLSILIFHRVHAETDLLFPTDPDAARFRELMAFLARSFTMLPLDEAIRRMNEGNLPARALCVTFDDGYTDNYEVACPILKSLGIPATFFVSTGFMDGGEMWNDRVIEAVRNHGSKSLDLTAAVGGRFTVPSPTGTPDEKRATSEAILNEIKYYAYDDRLAAVARIESAADARRSGKVMMSPQQVRALRGEGMTIGGHTVSHPILMRLDADHAREEIAAGKARLEALLGERIGLFAYPNGKPGKDYGAREVALVREAGFDAAVTTSWGVAGKGCDPYQLPRFSPWDRNPVRFGLRMVHNLTRRNFACA